MITDPDLAPYAGMYGEGSGNVMIDDDLRPGSAKEELYSEAMTGWYTAAEMKKKYGYDDAKLEQLKHEDRLDLKLKDGEWQYRLSVQKMDKFTEVVLHEIGHSVDEMLGKRTSPVFDFAGWHQYSDATFDQWAAEMGGWDRVSSDDKKKIREVWIDAARGRSPVKELVPPDHPALSSTYEREGVGLVKFARAGETFDYTNRTRVGDRVFIAGSYDDVWSSVKAEAVDTAPSVYSIYAAAEYFAESYVEYYRNVDGTPGSAAKKGGALASPVKQWFDKNVDSIKFDPARFKGGASDKSDDELPGKAAAQAGPTKPAGKTSKT